MSPYQPVAEDRPDRLRIKTRDYSHYQKDGYLLVKNVVSQDEIDFLKSHAMDILHGRVAISGLEPPKPESTEKELIARFSRVHQLHRVDAVSEQFMLHPRALDVLEALIGPDVLALQTMLFYNAPEMGGQGWHQDAYYIWTYPDTLIGCWIALEEVDEENGCLWVAPGSHVEPIYPDENGTFIHADDVFEHLFRIHNASNLDDNINTLAPIAAKYGDAVSVPMNPGDVLFFHGHLLHRSYPNRSTYRWRRAFVSHYCNARSWVPWNHGAPYEGDCANAQHILARGKTHMPFAQPHFGTECAATQYAGLAQSGDAPTLSSASNPNFNWGRQEEKA